MTDLIRRLEEAKEGSHDLDCAFAEAIDPGSHCRIRCVGDERAVWFRTKDAKIDVPEFTTNLQDAVSAVPEGHDWLRKSLNSMTVVRLLTPEYEARKLWPPHYDAKAETPALALCIAILRAMEAKNE